MKIPVDTPFHKASSCCYSGLRTATDECVVLFIDLHMFSSLTHFLDVTKKGLGMHIIFYLLSCCCYRYNDTSTFVLQIYY